MMTMMMVQSLVNKLIITINNEFIFFFNQKNTFENYLHVFYNDNHNIGLDSYRRINYSSSFERCGFSFRITSTVI